MIASEWKRLEMELVETSPEQFHSSRQKVRNISRQSISCIGHLASFHLIPLRAGTDSDIQTVPINGLIHQTSYILGFCDPTQKINLPYDSLFLIYNNTYLNWIHNLNKQDKIMQ